MNKIWEMFWMLWLLVSIVKVKSDLFDFHIPAINLYLWLSLVCLFCSPPIPHLNASSLMRWYSLVLLLTRLEMSVSLRPFPYFWLKSDVLGFKWVSTAQINALHLTIRHSGTNYRDDKCFLYNGVIGLKFLDCLWILFRFWQLYV